MHAAHHSDHNSGVNVRFLELFISRLLAICSVVKSYNIYMKCDVLHHLLRTSLVQKRILTLFLFTGRSLHVMTTRSMLQAVHRIILPSMLRVLVVTLCPWVEARVIQVLLLNT